MYVCMYVCNIFEWINCKTNTDSAHDAYLPMVSHKVMNHQREQPSLDETIIHEPILV